MLKISHEIKQLSVPENNNNEQKISKYMQYGWDAFTTNTAKTELKNLMYWPNNQLNFDTKIFTLQGNSYVISDIKRNIDYVNDAYNTSFENFMMEASLQDLLLFLYRNQNIDSKKMQYDFEKYLLQNQFKSINKSKALLISQFLNEVNPQYNNMYFSNLMDNTENFIKNSDTKYHTQDLKTELLHTAYQKDFWEFFTRGNPKDIKKYLYTNQENIDIDTLLSQTKKYIQTNSTVGREFSSKDREKLLIIWNFLFNQRLTKQQQQELIAIYSIYKVENSIWNNIKIEWLKRDYERRGLKALLNDSSPEVLKSFLYNNSSDINIYTLKIRVDRYIFHKTNAKYDFPQEEQEKLKIILQYLEKNISGYRGYEKFQKNIH